MTKSQIGLKKTKFLKLFGGELELIGSTTFFYSHNEGEPLIILY
jgi:hypothetical protein